jgi:uncharacterized membrane protein YphA (DoxX/SURF4 family)
MNTTKLKSIGYWSATVIIALVLLSGGVAMLMRQQGNVDGVVHLGYPVYFVTILGVWKVLGAAVLLAPGFPRLKEWAYAGTFIDMTSAFASHVACRDPVWHLAVPLAFAMITVASWALRPPGRTLGNLFAPIASPQAA